MRITNFIEQNTMANSYYDPADLRKFGKITEWSEEIGNKCFDYYGKVFEEGALSAREKSLIALAVAHVVIHSFPTRRSSDHRKSVV